MFGVLFTDFKATLKAIPSKFREGLLYPQEFEILSMKP